MARQSGLGRGLAALLPPAHLHEQAQAPRPERAVARANDDAVPTAFGVDLLADLAANQSGLGLIYQALGNLVADYELHDAALIIDEPGLGRQVFTAERRPLEEDEEEALLAAQPGLYTDPVLPTDFDATTLTSLCVVALRLDLLRYDAWHDPLTALYDRRSFDRLLEMAVARSTRYRWPFTLVLIDLDGFKELNDRDGHAAGDAALRTLGERFSRILRFGDNAARIGGDEFAIILPSTDPADVPALLERIGAPIEGEPPCQPFSYGVAVCPNEAEDFDSLFRLADERLYQAKEGRP